MAIIRNIKGNLVNLEPLICCTVSYFRDKLHVKLKEKEQVPMATTNAYFMAKQNFLPEFTPFDRSLKKLYGNDFFDDEPDKTPDFDGCILLRSGDIPRIGRYPFLAQDHIRIIEKLCNNKYENVGKESNLATKHLIKEAIWRYMSQ